MDFSADQIDALTYGRGMDTSRFVQATGFVPAYSSLAALEEFAAAATRACSARSGSRSVAAWRRDRAGWSRRG